MLGDMAEVKRLAFKISISILGKEYNRISFEDQFRILAMILGFSQKIICF